ncbi:MAG: hypothetical protein ACI4J8_09430 [Oscillospiraceae bacterium]
MRKYKCPECGKISTSLYCDTCQKSIPTHCAIDNMDNMTEESAALAQTDILSELKEYTKRNNYLLSEVERHTKVMSVIMIISAVMSLASAVFTIIGLSQLGF